MIYSWDEWSSMTDEQRNEAMRVAFHESRDNRIGLAAKYVASDPFKNLNDRLATREPLFKPLGTDFDRQFMKDCGISTEDL